MAFSHTRQEVHAGPKRIVFGTYDSDSVTTGEIVTDLNVVETFILTPSGASVSGNQSTYNETLPLSNTDGAVTVITTSSEVGSYMAIGI